MQQELSDKIREAADSYIGNLGYELVDLVSFRSGGKLILRFLVDKPTGGITLKECARLNEELGGFLERENITGEGYLLEVSSPGADRPLLAEKDFLRVYGRQVRVFLSESKGKKNEIEGVVEKVGNGFLDLAVDGKIEKVNLKHIIRAKQVIA